MNENYNPNICDSRDAQVGLDAAINEHLNKPYSLPGSPVPITGIISDQDVKKLEELASKLSGEKRLNIPIVPVGKGDFNLFSSDLMEKRNKYTVTISMKSLEKDKPYLDKLGI